MGTRKDGITLVDQGGGGPSTPVEITAPLGQQLMTDSVSVVIASDQTAVPVTIADPVTIVEPVTVDQGAANTNLNAWPIKVTDGIIDTLVRAAGSKPDYDTDPAFIASPREVELHNTGKTMESFLMIGGYDQFNNINKKLPIRSEFDPIQKADSDPGVLTRNLNPVIFFSETFVGNSTLSAQILRYNAATVFITIIDNGGFVGTLTPLLINNVGNSFPTFAYDVETSERVTQLLQDKAYFATVAGADTFAVKCTGFGGGSSTVRIAVSPEPSGILTTHISNTSPIPTTGLTDAELRATPVLVDTELPDAAALADNTANPTVPSVGSLGLMFDGATWDRIRGTSTDGLLVNLGANNDVVPGANVALTSLGTPITALDDFVTLSTPPQGYKYIVFFLSPGPFNGILEFRYDSFGIGGLRPVFDVNNQKWITSIDWPSSANGQFFLVPIIPSASFVIYCIQYTSGSMSVTGVNATLTNLVGAPLTNIELRETPLDVNTTAIATEEAPEYTEATAELLSQTLQGYLRVLTAGLVSDTPPSYITGEQRPYSLTTEGRIRVSTVDARIPKMEDMCPGFSSIGNPWDATPDPRSYI